MTRLEINNKPFVMVLQSRVLIFLKDEDGLSHSQVVIDTVPSSFKAKYIFENVLASTLFRVADIIKVIFIIFFIPKIIPKV